jgi:hypothetical protein
MSYMKTYRCEIHIEDHFEVQIQAHDEDSAKELARAMAGDISPDFPQPIWPLEWIDGSIQVETEEVKA